MDDVTAMLQDLVGLGTIDLGLERFLEASVAARKNIVVCGGLRSGKTTLLRALADAIPRSESVLTIEDTFELGLDGFPELWALEVPRPSIGQRAITAADLVRAGLRMDADRLIVGEVRGAAEALSVLSAMSQNTAVSMCTVHAHSSTEAVGRLTSYALLAPGFFRETAQLLVADAVDVVLFVGYERAGRGGASRRYVSSVIEVVAGGSTTNEIFRPGPDGRAVPGTPMGPELLGDLQDVGYDASYLDRPEGWWTS